LIIASFWKKIVRSQDGRRKVQPFDHPLGGELRRRMRYVHERVCVGHREVDNALHSGIVCEPQSEQCSCQFVSDHWIEKEQCVDPLQSRSHRFGIKHIAFHRAHSDWWPHRVKPGGMLRPPLAFACEGGGKHDVEKALPMCQFLGRLV